MSRQSDDEHAKTLPPWKLGGQLLAAWWRITWAKVRGRPLSQRKEKLLWSLAWQSEREVDRILNMIETLKARSESADPASIPWPDDKPRP